MCRVPSEFSQRSCCQLNVQIFYAFSSQCLYLISTGIQVANSSHIFFKIPELNSPHCTIVKNIKTSFRKQFILTIWIIFTKLYAKEYFWYILSYLILHDMIKALYAVSTHHTPVVFLFYNQSDIFHTYQVSRILWLSHALWSQNTSSPKENQTKSPAWTLSSVNPATFTIRPRKLWKKQKLLKREGNKEFMSTNTWW